MYTKDSYKDEIKIILQTKGYDPIFLAKKTYEIYLNHIREIDKDLRNSLLNIATMENGPEFELTEEEFKKTLEEM